MRIPFAFAIDLVLAERDVFDVHLQTSLPKPAPDVIISGPPVQLGDHEGHCGAGVDGPTTVRSFVALAIAQVLVGVAPRRLVVMAMIPLIVPITVPVMVPIMVPLIVSIILSIIVSIVIPTVVSVVSVVVPAVVAMVVAVGVSAGVPMVIVVVASVILPVIIMTAVRVIIVPPPVLLLLVLLVGVKVDLEIIVGHGGQISNTGTTQCWTWLEGKRLCVSTLGEGLQEAGMLLKNNCS